MAAAAGTGVSILVAGVLGALVTMMKRHEQVLDRGGRRAVAVVVDTTNRNRWVSDTAKLRYFHEGREYEADVTVEDAGDFLVGFKVEVVYDPEHPTHANHPLRADRRTGREARHRLRGADHGAGRSCPRSFRGPGPRRSGHLAERACSAGAAGGSTVAGRVRMEGSWGRWP